jgi:hypothetical protein
MPVRRKYDMEGPYYQYGNTGAKYRYKPNDLVSRRRAFNKAKLQEIAIVFKKKYKKH